MGFFTVPQGLAYALLAGVPPVVGLYTALFPPLFYALFTTSKHLSFGPDAVTCLLLGALVREAVLKHAALQDLDAPALLQDPVAVMGYASIASMVVGVILFSFGILRLGFLDSVLARPAIDALLVAVAGTIVTSQIPAILGIPSCPRLGSANSSGHPGEGADSDALSSTLSCPESPLEKWIMIFSSLFGVTPGQGGHQVWIPRPHLPTVLTSAAVLAALVGLTWAKTRLSTSLSPVLSRTKYLPVVLIVMLASLLCSWAFSAQKWGIDVLGSPSSRNGIGKDPAEGTGAEADTGANTPVSGGKVGIFSGGSLLPQFPPSPLSVVQLCLRPALVIATIIFIKSLVISKEYAARHGYRIRADQELRALGLANLFAPFFGAITASGCLGRTRLNDAAGARTPFSSIIAAAIALFAILFLMPLLGLLPSCVLAVTIVHTVFPLITSHSSYVGVLIRMRAGVDIALFAGMVFLAAVSDIETALIFGFGTCLLRLIRLTGTPSLEVLAELKPQGEAQRGSREFVSLLHCDRLGSSTRRSRSGAIGSSREDSHSSANALTPPVETLGSSRGRRGEWGMRTGAVSTSTSHLNVEIPHLIPGVLIVRVFGPIHFGNSEQYQVVFMRLINTYPRDEPSLLAEEDEGGEGRIGEERGDRFDRENGATMIPPEPLGDGGLSEALHNPSSLALTSSSHLALSPRNRRYPRQFPQTPAFGEDEGCYERSNEMMDGRSGERPSERSGRHEEHSPLPTSSPTSTLTSGEGSTIQSRKSVMEEKSRGANRVPLRCMLFDFSHVPILDASAVQMLSHILDVLSEQGVYSAFVASALPASSSSRLETETNQSPLSGFENGRDVETALGSRVNDSPSAAHSATAIVSSGNAHVHARPHHCLSTRTSDLQGKLLGKIVKSYRPMGEEEVNTPLYLLLAQHMRLIPKHREYRNESPGSGSVNQRHNRSHPSQYQVNIDHNTHDHVFLTLDSAVQAVYDAGLVIRPSALSRSSLH